MFIFLFGEYYCNNETYQEKLNKNRHKALILPSAYMPILGLLNLILFLIIHLFKLLDKFSIFFLFRN